MTKRTKALAITPRVKTIVWQRDGERCIVCGSPRAAPEAHFVARSQGGLGIEENIVTLCLMCHTDFDFGSAATRQAIADIARAHLKSHYPYWSEDDLIYRKG